MSISLKFPDKQIAVSYLYQNGSYVYTNTYDADGQGIATERYTQEDGTQALRIPIDGSYCADIAGLEEVPEALKPFVVTPQYRKHLFLGE